MNAPLRTVVVDDESLARQRLKRLLAKDQRVQVVGEAADVPTARAMVAQLKPALLFLDVRMPGEDGFALLAELPAELCPFVVFVTAQPDAAVRAFDVRAMDFLVKPVRPERLAESISRAVEAAVPAGSLPSLVDEHVHTELGRLLRSLKEERPTDVFAAFQHFAVTVGRRTRFITLTDIDWFEADGNYIRLHVGREVHLVRMTMQRLEHGLDARKFVRVHRSHIVPLDRIRELIQLVSGDYELLLTTGITLPVMRTYRDRLPLG